MNIIDYFDVNNPQHLRAWLYLNQMGFLPQSFTSELENNHIEFCNTWQIGIAFKMANAHVNLKLQGFN